MSNVETLKKIVRKSIRLGHSNYIIKEFVKSTGNYKKLDDSIIDDVVNDVVEDYPNYGLIQKVVRSKLVCDMHAEDQNYRILDEVERSIDTIDKNRLSDMLDSKFDLKSKVYTAKYEYRPLEPGMLLKNKDGTYTYNSYKPPFWLEDWFYTGGKLQPTKINTIPDVYGKFLNHLVGDGYESKASYDYIINWLANGLKRKNYCILTTIGKQGIGKGVLGSIMKQLFGMSNYYEGGDRMFKGTFNSQIADRRLVYCDEISIKDREDEDRLKLVVNDSIEIEKKGIDAKISTNYASFYISSNHMDSITITADDRRFSIVELTDQKLLKVMSPEEIRSLLKPDNIAKLANYLWHVEVNEKEMSQVFITERTSAIRAMGLKEWESWVLEEYCPANVGKEIKLYDVGDAVKDQFGYGTRVGRGRFMELQNKYPEFFKVVSTKDGNKTVWVIRISDEL
jgi:hypothetical protein